MGEHVEDQGAEVFVAACLAGELDEVHRWAAEGAVMWATEHGFVDDAARVAAIARATVKEATGAQ